jgi:hypothetical protein
MGFSLNPFARKQKEQNPHTTPQIFLDSSGGSKDVALISYLAENRSISREVQERHAGSDIVQTSFSNLMTEDIYQIVRDRKRLQQIRRNNTPRIRIFKEGQNLAQDYEDMEFNQAFFIAAKKAGTENGNNLLKAATNNSTIVETKSMNPQQVVEKKWGLLGFLGI